MRTTLAGLLLALPLPPQTPSAEIPVERVREVVTFLASDELAGRDTPSPGLEQAADYLARQFAAAGLEPLRPDDWFHRYELPGEELDSTAIRVTVHPEGKPDRVLEPDVDVRLLRRGEKIEGDRELSTVILANDPRLRRMLMARGGRQPLFVELGESNAYWKRAAGARRTLRSRRLGARPVFLVREGLLPEDEEGFFATYTVPAATEVAVPLRNVVGVLRGSELPNEYVAVTAHYDHVGVGMPVGGDAIYNGADDDATGTTAVVTLAEALAAGPRPRRSVLFVCFSGEEKGLRGSRAFVEQPPVDLASVVADVNIEMLGRPSEGQERQAWITGAHYSDFAAVVGPALERAGIRVTDYEHAARLFSGSDNLSFARKGVVAHSISAGTLHEDYHRPSDEVDRLDIEHMTAVINGLREVVLVLANREERLSYNEQGRAFLDRLAGR